MGRHRRGRRNYRRIKQEEDEDKNEEEADEEEDEVEEEIEAPSPKKRRVNSSPTAPPVVNLLPPEPKISLAGSYNTRLRVKEDVEEIERANKKSGSENSSDREEGYDVAQLQKKAYEMQTQLSAFQKELRKLQGKKKTVHADSEEIVDQHNYCDLSVASLKRTLKDEGKEALVASLQEQTKEKLVFAIVEFACCFFGIPHA